MTVLWSLLIGVLTGSAMTRLSMRIARVLKVMDNPGAIKIHDEPTPRFGGVGIAAGTLLGFLAVVPFLENSQIITLPVMVGGLAIAFTGALDDLKSLRPWQKLAGQLAGAIAFTVLSWSRLVVAFAGWPTIIWAAGTVLFIAYLSNSLNLLDGMDGLAGGMAVVMALFLALLGFFQGRLEVVSLSLALVGGCIGFLFYNTPKARTFMGDVGSLFLGYMLAVVAIELIVGAGGGVAALFSPVLVLALPLTDTAFAILRRLMGGQGISVGDRLHLYDCISRRNGGATWRTLWLMWGLTATLGTLGVIVHSSPMHVTIFVTGMALLWLVALGIRVGSLRAGVSGSCQGS